MYRDVESIIGNMFLWIVMMGFIHFNLKSKVRKPAVAFVFIGTIGAIFLALLPYVYFDNYPRVVAAALPFLIIAIYVIASFEGKMKEKLFVVVFSFVSIYTVMVLIEIPIVLIAQEQDLSGWKATFIIFIEAVVNACFYAVFTVFRRRYVQESGFGKNIALFLMFPLSQFAVSFTSFWVVNDKLGMGNLGDLALLVAVSILLCLLADTALFFIMLRNANHHRLQQELNFQEYKSQLNLEYYQSLQQDAVETRKMKHDLNNMIQVVYALSQEGVMQDKERAHKLLSDIEHTVHAIESPEYSENQMVNAIVASKAKICKRKGIQLHVDIQIPESLSISDIDLCRALTNILDNAINATAQLETIDERCIDLNLFIEKRYLYIKAINPFSPQEKKEGKKDKGYGLTILQDLALKYSGEFIATAEDNIYTVLLPLKIA